MTAKTTSTLLAVPFFAFAGLGIANEANAALIRGSTLNISGALQTDGPPESGSILFADPGSSLPGTNGAVLSDTTCEVGETCDLFVTSTTSSFTSIPIGLNDDAVTSFTPSGPGIIAFDILTLGDFTFSIDKRTIEIDVVDNIGNFSFNAMGFVESREGEFAKINFTGFTANGLLDNGVLGGDVIAGDGFSGVGSYSGTVIVVPEPLTMMGAGLAAGFGAFFKRKFSHQKKG